MGTKTVPHPPYCPNFAPRDFWLFPKLTGCRYEIIEMKEDVTKVIDTRVLQLEEITLKGTRVSCVYYQ